MENRYNKFVDHFRAKYGCRVQKLVVDAGFTCPNRDGSKGVGGCTFCDNNAFHPSYSTSDKSIHEQLSEGVAFHRGRYRTAARFLAYFQPYSNTYAPVERLRELYLEALSFPDVVGIAVGTRPDCLDGRKLDLLAEIAQEKEVVLEIGVESCYDTTLEHVNRRHSWQQAADAIGMARDRGLFVGSHFILGLPGETGEMMLEGAYRINSLPVNSVKFHQLQIIRGTRMEKEFAEHPERFVTWTVDEYVDFFVDILERLRPDICIERFAGEVPPRFVNSTPWGLMRNVELLRLLDRRLEERDTRQGILL